MVGKSYIVLALVACGPQPTEFIPIVTADHHNRDRWVEEVTTAVKIWNDALETTCGNRPLTVGDAGIPVYLLSDVDWTWRDDTIGVYLRGQIWVRGTRETRHQLTIIHEIGHALGLDHSDDINSVMYSTAYFPTITLENLNDVGCF